jgi:hypothetical protein
MNLHAYVISSFHRTRHDVPIIVASGFLATLAMTTIMYMLPLVHVGQVDAPLWVARLFVTDPVAAAAVGLTVHVFVGFAYAWLFADQVEPRLISGPMRAGFSYGIALWLFAQAIAVPSLGTVAVFVHGGGISPGLFAIRLGVGGAFASLTAHLAYGGVLGFVYGCLFRARCLNGAKSNVSSVPHRTR